MQDDRLLERCVASAAALWRVEVPGAAVIERPGGVIAALDARVPRSTIANAIVYEDERGLIDSYDELAHEYRRRGVRSWIVWAFERHSRALERLETAGHRNVEMTYAMGVELAPGALPVTTVASGREPGAGSAGFAALWALNDAAYDDEPELDFGHAFAGWPDDRGFVYLAREGGETAAGLMTMDHDGDCAVGFVATAPRHRRRGLARELMRRALADAAARGCSTATLQASAMGRPLYAALGFRELARYALMQRDEDRSGEGG